VKIWFKSGEDSFFKGTGFFIHSDGYLLTAYHCVKDCKNNIVVESLSVGTKRAVVVPELSLPGADIAVLQLSDPSMENTAPHYLPLGFVTEAELNSDVVVLGYPQRDGAQWVAEVATYQGHINRLFREGEAFFLECQAIVGKGQSGSPVYHPATRRVVAVAHSMYEGMRSGDAVRFEPLFQSHPKLKSLNQKSELVWEQQLITTDREILQQQQEELQRLRLQREHGERELARQQAEIERKQQEEIARLKQVQEQREIEKRESEQKLAQQQEELQRLRLQQEREKQELAQQQAEIERKQQEEIARLKQVQEQREIEKRESEQKLAREKKSSFSIFRSILLLLVVTIVFNRYQHREITESPVSQQPSITTTETSKLPPVEHKDQPVPAETTAPPEKKTPTEDKKDWLQKGYELSKQGKLDEALDAYRKALEIDPKFANAWYNMGIVFEEQGKLDEALDAYRKALEIDPKLANAWIGMGNTLNNQGKLDEALDAYRKALKFDPKNALAWNNMGAVLNSQGKLDKALDACRKALEIDPKYADAWYNMGIVLRKQGKLDEALDAYRKTLEIDPKYADAWYNMGTALDDQGKVDEALDAYRKALEIEPKFAFAWNNMGVVLHKQGKLDEAISAYRKYLEIVPDNQDVKTNLDRLLKK